MFVFKKLGSISIINIDCSEIIIYAIDYIYMMISQSFQLDDLVSTCMKIMDF